MVASKTCSPEPGDAEEVERSRERGREREREVEREEKKTQGGCVGQSVPQTCHVDAVAWDLRA